MLNNRLAVIIALAAAMAASSVVYGVESSSLANENKEDAAVIKPTQEENLKKFKTAPDSTVLAIVGSKQITKGELISTMWDWYAPQLLDEYINTLVVAQAMEKEGLNVTDAEIQAKIDETRLAPGETLESMLQRFKQTISRLRSGHSITLGLRKIMDKRTVVSDAEYAEFIKARQILVSFLPNSPTATAPTTQEEKAKLEEAALEKAEKIIEEIKGGKSFEDAAKEYSDDPATKNKGGDLGWFRKGEWNRDISSQLFTMKQGEISEPLKSYMGYLIVKVEKLGKDATEEERAALRDRLLGQKLNTEMGRLFMELKSSTEIDNKLSPELPQMQQPSLIPGGVEQD